MLARLRPLLAVAALLAASACATPKPKPTHDGPEPLLLDVRTRSEWNAGHIDGALLVPVNEVASELDSIATEADGRPVVIYCRSGARAQHAKRLLEQRGLTVLDTGGMGEIRERWVR